jgi:hypothetical protein
MVITWCLNNSQTAALNPELVVVSPQTLHSPAEKMPELKVI